MKMNEFYSLVNIEGFPNLHIIPSRQINYLCLPDKDKGTLCGLDSLSKSNKIFRNYYDSCCNEDKILELIIKHPNRKEICGNCVAHFFADI